MKIENIVIISNNNGFKALWIRTKLTLRYFYKTRKLTLGAFITLVLFVIWLIYDGKGVKIEGWNSFGNLFNIGTLVVILAVWWAELKEDWRKSLPKYMSAIFEFKGEECKELSYTEYALVIGESDIRSLSQQLGMQKNNGIPLSFDPTKYRVKSEIKYGYCANQCKFAFQHFTIYGKLKKIPKKREYKKKEEYLSKIVNNLEQLMEKTEAEYEKDFVIEIRQMITKLSEKIDKNDKN